MQVASSADPKCLNDLLKIFLPLPLEGIRELITNEADAFDEEFQIRDWNFTE